METYKAFLVIDSYGRRFIIEGKEKADAFNLAQRSLGLMNPITLCEELEKEELLCFCNA